MKTPEYIDQLMNLPGGSLLIGTLAIIDGEGAPSTNAIIEGTPASFRVLAGVLLKMADTVETMTEAETGWHLALHPDDIPALKLLDVESLSLGCQFQLNSEDAFSWSGFGLYPQPGHRTYRE